MRALLSSFPSGVFDMSESTTQNGSRPKTPRARKASAKKAAAAAPVKPSVPPQTEVIAVHLDVAERRNMIALAAYYRAERRRFASGHELEDWLSAEREIDALLSARLTTPEAEARRA
jgi:hypothetical protein